MSELTKPEAIEKLSQLTNSAVASISQAMELAKEYNLPFSFYMNESFSGISESEPFTEDTDWESSDEEWEESDDWYDSGCSDDDWYDSSC